jgi:glycosyltransferase involved in cell wall biosynthesis
MPDVSRTPRLRINWFSPLRPANTDIAHYALRTIPALARHAEVAVWAERAYWPRELDICTRPRHWDGRSWAALNSADATLFHLGNNALYHGWIWDVARRHPGILVLHDTRLHEFFAPTLLEGSDGGRAYLAEVRRVHGETAVREAERMLRGDTLVHSLAESIPFTALAVERARGVIVHTADGFNQVRALGLCPVLQLDLPYEAGPPPPAREWDGTLRMVAFGYLGPNRRLEALLDAIAASPDRSRLRLEILGQHRDPEALTGRVDALKLGEQVRFRGFVPEAELNATLDRSHLAVNLRYPTMGEASGSQLRIWSRGLASVVTRTGWYAELPPEAVWFVDPANEAVDLQSHFTAALARPDALRAMGEAGRRILEDRHDPARYAAELIEGIRRMMGSPASVIGEAIVAISRIAEESGIRGAARASIARHAAGELSRWLSPGGSVGDGQAGDA